MVLGAINVLISLIILSVIVYHGVEGDCAGPTSGKTIFAVFIGILHLLLFMGALKGYSDIQGANKKKEYLIGLLFYIFSNIVCMVSLVLTIKYCQDNMFWFVILWPCIMCCFLTSMIILYPATFLPIL